jgi:hypothetical protein
MRLETCIRKGLGVKAHRVRGVERHRTRPEAKPFARFRSVQTRSHTTARASRADREALMKHQPGPGRGRLRSATTRIPPASVAQDEVDLGSRVANLDGELRCFHLPGQAQAANLLLQRVLEAETVSVQGLIESNRPCSLRWRLSTSGPVGSAPVVWRGLVGVAVGLLAARRPPR